MRRKRLITWRWLGFIDLIDFIHSKISFHSFEVGKPCLCVFRYSNIIFAVCLRILKYGSTISNSALTLHLPESEKWKCGRTVIYRSSGELYTGRVLQRFPTLVIEKIQSKTSLSALETSITGTTFLGVPVFGEMEKRIHPSPSIKPAKYAASVLRNLIFTKSLAPCDKPNSQHLKQMLLGLLLSFLAITELLKLRYSFFKNLISSLVHDFLLITKEYHNKLSLSNNKFSLVV